MATFGLRAVHVLALLKHLRHRPLIGINEKEQQQVFLTDLVPISFPAVCVLSVN